MKIIYKTGNLINASEKLILHGANAQGVMGSGVALAIRNKYPKAYEDYRNHFLRYGLKLGDVIFSNNGSITFANGITQEYYGRDGKQYVDYEAINIVMKKVNEYCNLNNITEIAMPLIGAGYGGGDWGIISEIIEKECTDTQPIVYVIDGKFLNNEKF